MYNSDCEIILKFLTNLIYMNCFLFDNTHYFKLNQVSTPWIKKDLDYLSGKVLNYKITTTTYNTYENSCILTMNK